MVKNLSASAGDAGSVPGSGRFPGVGNGNHSHILPGTSCGPKSLAGCSLWVAKESDMI